MTMPASARPILLIGLRGSGKSTLGRRLSEALELPFIDLDKRTIRRLGLASVAEAFEKVGEAGFRDAELAALTESLGATAVIALGGGTPAAPAARAAIESARQFGARVIWTDAPDEVLLQRIAGDGNRPPLTDLDPRSEIASLREARQRTYRGLADLRIDTEAFSLDGAIRAVTLALADETGPARPAD